MNESLMSVAPDSPGGAQALAADRAKARKELEEILQARLKIRMQEYAVKHHCNVLSAMGHIIHENQVYRVYFNTPANNPWRRLRHKLGFTSGRQWRKFCKQSKLRKRLSAEDMPIVE